jgi:hypothetical protein
MRSGACYNARMGVVPFELKPRCNVLISGCDGGFDFFCGTPVGLALERQGHSVIYSSSVWVSPLTALPWFMDDEAVAQSKIYYDGVVAATTSLGAHNVIEEYIRGNPNRRREEIPI